MSFKINPLADRVVVKAAPAEEVSKGGIILPDTAQEKPQIGTVIAVGPGKTSDTGTVIKLTVKKGEKILYGKYSGTDVTVDGEEYMIMRESDILAIM
jgi:chaperonin GroES